jgi:RNA polymerase sigma factor (sigma-70 family)
MPEDHSRHKPQMLGVAQEFPTTVTYGRINHIFSVARQRARAHGLRADNAEDTSQEFGNSWLLDLKADKPWAKRCLDSEAYLLSCADKHVLTAVARLRSQYNRERQWPNRAGDEDAEDIENRSCAQPGPEKQAIRSELRAVLFWAIRQLNPRPQAIYIRRKIHRESVISIAMDLNCTANAVSQSLSASHQQVLSHLAAAGYDDAEICEYLYDLFGPD